MSTSPLELDPYVIPMISGTRILDLGCGYGHWGHLVWTHYAARRHEPVHIIGVDLYEGNVAFCRNSGVYSDVIHDDVVSFLKRQSDASFDTVIATELIEHLETDKGKELLTELDRVTAKVAILSTPNFPALRGGGETPFGFNEWEHHLSQWNRSDFPTSRISRIGDLPQAASNGSWRLSITPLVAGA